MKKVITALLLLACIPIFSTAQVFEEKDGFLRVEAEAFSKQTATEIRKWYIMDSTTQIDSGLRDTDESHAESASGKKYIEILPDTRTNHQETLIKGENFSGDAGKLAVVHYKINIITPGRYYIWAKAFSTGSEDNGIHVGLNGKWPESGKRMQWCEGKNEWTWASKQRTKEVHCGVPGLIYLDIEKAGEHEIQFSMREDGFEMDEWLMTTDKNFDPRPKKETTSALSRINWSKIKEAYPSAIVIKAQEFDNLDGQFYKNRNWLAINPDKNKKAVASKVYEGPSGLFNVVFFGVGENDGRSRFTLTVNDFEQGSYRPPLSTEMFEESHDYAKSFSDLQLNTGDSIKITAEIGSTDGKEYSRGRWAGIAIVPIGQGEAVIDLLQQEIAANIVVKQTGELKKWHTVTFTFDGPETSETEEYNPFFNYRLNARFTHSSSGKSYNIPGHFAADGNAGQTGFESGNKWRVHFTPDETGEWTYDVDFRKGRWVAVSSKKDAGVSGGFMDGANGSFEIAPTDKTGRDFRAKGRLQYVGERYLKFAETGEYFLKQGPDAPENFLSFEDFDGTFHADGHKDNLVKTWAAHEKDWTKEDPTWRNGTGKAIIGALNYLASKGLNSVSFLTNNIQGDDQNVFPYIDYETFDRIDVSKMDQWEIVFDHAQKNGLFLHFKLLEMENQGLLDGGGVGANSKLYYREMMSRFGHHLALNWNLAEEDGEWVKNHPTPPRDTQQRLATINYFGRFDPYHHHLVIHNGIQYDDLLGPDNALTGPSIQTHQVDFRKVHEDALHWIKASNEAGKQWAVAVDEPGDAQHSLLPDAEDPDHDIPRRNALWGTFMAGGWGNEWYFGYKHQHSDLTCEDYRSRDLFWDQTKHALDFFKDNEIPFWEMENRNDLVGNPENKNTVYCLAKPNHSYVVYLNSVATTTLDLTGAFGDYDVFWFNPKKGGGPIKSKVKKVRGGKEVDLGKSPDKKQQDWAILIQKVN